MIIGLISELDEDRIPTGQGAMQARSIARLELIGELRPVAGVARFQRGIESYPKIGDGAVLMTERELRIVYGTADGDHAHIGDLKQHTNIGVHIDIDSLVSRHFAILGTTGVGKSSGVAAILQKILAARPNLRIFLLDPHNEYSQCFGDKAQVLLIRGGRRSCASRSMLPCRPELRPDSHAFGRAVDASVARPQACWHRNQFPVSCLTGGVHSMCM